MRDNIKAIIADTSGATAVEYGLILALIFLAMVGAVTGVGTESIEMWDTVSDEVKTARAKAS